MAFTKRISLDLSQNLGTGLTVYAIVRRTSDKTVIDDADGTFKASPSDSFIQLTEDSVVKGFYEKDEKRTVWADGAYTEFFYKQSGASPAPASDTLVGINKISIFLDQIVSLSTVMIRLRTLESLLNSLKTDRSQDKFDLSESLGGIGRSINSIGDGIGKSGLDRRQKTSIGDL